MDGRAANAVRLLFRDAGAEALKAKSRAKSQNEGGSGGFGFKNYCEKTGLPLYFRPGFENAQTVLLLRALNDEARPVF